MNRQQIINFQKKIELDIISGCWVWIGSINHNGYSVFRDGKKTTSGHRMSYEHWNGYIPKGLQINHKCRNRLCVNPELRS